MLLADKLDPTVDHQVAIVRNVRLAVPMPPSTSSITLLPPALGVAWLTAIRPLTNWLRRHVLDAVQIDAQGAAIGRLRVVQITPILAPAQPVQTVQVLDSKPRAGTDGEAWRATMRCS